MLIQHFDWDLTHQVAPFSLHVAQPSYELERPALKTGRCSYFGAVLAFVVANFLQKYPYVRESISSSISS